MNKQLLKGLILEQKMALMAESTGIPREAYAHLIEPLFLPHALVITGLRRAGKSTLLLQLIQNEFKWDVYYFNLEDERLINFTVRDFNTLYELMIELYGERKIFFLDEIQNVPEWERFVRRLQNEKIKFILTGSNASLLSKELGTKLTGRHIQIELFPYSFREYLQYHAIEFHENDFLITHQRALLKKRFNEYLQGGGIPEFVTYQLPHILTNLYEDIIYKDIIVRYEIESVRAFRELALYLLNNTGTYLSYSKLKNALNLGSVNTVKNYVHYLENSYLIQTIDSYAYSILERSQSQKKIYGIDTGLIKAISTDFSPNTGKYLENIVFLELKRQYEAIYYYRTSTNLEVDFVVRKGRKIELLIQVCETLSHEKTRERELKALSMAMKELKLKEGLILTLDEIESIELEDGCMIRVIPVYQWILGFS